MLFGSLDLGDKLRNRITLHEPIGKPWTPMIEKVKRNDPMLEHIFLTLGYTDRSIAFYERVLPEQELP